MDGQQKFDTCRFRSLEMYNVVIGACCGNSKADMQYQCFIFEDISVNPNVCEACLKYKPKIQEETT